MLHARVEFARLIAIGKKINYEKIKNHTGGGTLVYIIIHIKFELQVYHPRNKIKI